MSSRLMTLHKRELATGSRVDMTGYNSVFGSLGASAFPILSRMDFIPLDGQGSTLNITGEGDSPSPRWIGLDSKTMQFWSYVYCSPLAAVIDRLAEADTNGLIKFVDEESRVTVKNVNKNPKLLRIKKLLKKPNPWQTWEEFEGEQVVICKVFGYCPVFAIGPAGFDKSYSRALVNLHPLLVTPQGWDDFNIFGKTGQIKYWNLSIGGNTWDIPASDVMVVKDGFMSKTNELGLPMSKIYGLDFFVSNICAAMEADNVLLKKKGPLGVFSYDPAKDMAGAVPLEPAAKDELQEDLKRYGLTLGQLQYVISKMPIKWNPMSFNIRDLMTKETIRAGIDGICDRFGYPAELMSGKNATYENRNSSEKWLYNNNVIPFSMRRMTRYNEFFELEDSAVLTKDYDHLPVLQEDIVKAGEAYKQEAEGLDIEWKSGMITWNQWQTAKGRDTVAGMDIYYPEWLANNPSLNPNNVKEKKDGKEDAPEDTGTEE
jgi:hypothetical protein